MALGTLTISCALGQIIFRATGWSAAREPEKRRRRRVADVTPRVATWQGSGLSPRGRQGANAVVGPDRSCFNARVVIATIGPALSPWRPERTRRDRVPELEWADQLVTPTSAAGTGGTGGRRVGYRTWPRYARPGPLLHAVLANRS
jgi:hypothetical protein